MAKTIKKFAVFDIDGTLIRWQLYHALADNLVKLGFIAPVKFQAIKDARMVWKRRESSESFKQYEKQIVSLYENILFEISEDQFNQAALGVFEEYKDQVYTYTRDLLAKLRSQKYLLFAISGSQAQIVSKMAGYYKFDDFIAREDEYQNDSFTGRSTTPIFNKDIQLKKIVKRNSAVFDDSIAVGDSATDIKMLELVEKPIAFNPEQKLFKVAIKSKWPIVVERKNVIYKLEEINGKYQLAETTAG